MTAAPTTMPPCPSWCEASVSGHREDFDGESVFDGTPERCHAIEYKQVTAYTDRPGPGRVEQPNAFVSIVGVERMIGAVMAADPIRVAVETTGYPQFTATEARRLAALLLQAAEQADEIGSLAASS